MIYQLHVQLYDERIQVLVKMSSYNDLSITSINREKEYTKSTSLSSHFSKKMECEFK